jgi:exonuclease SbcC
MIEELTLRGFKSYRGKQTIRFTPGVNKISGRNASGKTTLLEAVMFGLYGDVPGVNKRDLVSLGADEVFVSVTFRSPFGGVKVLIKRAGTLTGGRGGEEPAFKATELYMEVEGDKAPLAKEKDVQARLRELLGVGRSTFFNVVYAKQKEFVEILNPDRNRMNAVLGLTAPTEAREELREAARALEAKGGIPEKPAVEERIKNAEKQIVEGVSQLEEARKRKGGLEDELKGKRKAHSEAHAKVEAAEELENGFKELEKQRKDFEFNEGLHDNKAEALEMLLSELGERPEERRGELEAKRKSAEATEERLRCLVDEDLDKERRGLDGDVATLSHRLQEHGRLKEQGLTVCPKCGQPIDFKLIEEDLARWTGELKAKRRRLSSLEAEIREIRVQEKAARERLREAEGQLTRFSQQERQVADLRREMGQIEEKTAKLAARVEEANTKLLERAEGELGATFTSVEGASRRLDERLRVLRKEESELYAEVRSREDLLRETERIEGDLDARLSALRLALSEAKAKLDTIHEYEAKIRTVEGIVEQYGRYERDLRENTLRMLEYRTYEYFRRLTDQQLYSGCHIDRERYVLEVQPIGSPRMLAAWRAGGGHESLFALAERLALLRVMGFPHLLILDEPTDAVDSENVPQLLEYIALSSQELGQVLLVTHHGQGEEEGVNLIRVRKVDSESRVFQEAGEG